MWSDKNYLLGIITFPTSTGLESASIVVITLQRIKLRIRLYVENGSYDGAEFHSSSKLIVFSHKFVVFFFRWRPSRESSNNNFCPTETLSHSTSSQIQPSFNHLLAWLRSTRRNWQSHDRLAYRWLGLWVFCQCWNFVKADFDHTISRSTFNVQLQLLQRVS